MKMNKNSSRLLGCGVALLALSTQAHALEAQAFVERFEKIYGDIGYDIDLGEAALDGDTIVVSGGKVGLMPGEYGMDAFEFDTDITFSGVTEEADGSYRAESATIPDLEVEFASDPVGSMTLEDVRIDDIWLPAGEKVSMEGVVQLFRSFTTGPLAIDRDGKTIVSFEGMEASSAFEPDFAVAELESVSTLFAVRGIEIDLKDFAKDDLDVAEFTKMVGVTSIEGDIEQTMDWTMEDGRMVVDRFEFDFPALGSLNISMDVSGMTMDVMQEAYDMQAAVAASGLEPTDSEMKAQEAQALAMFGKIVPNSFTVRYDDSSLVGRLLDFMAKDNDMERSTFAGMAADVLEAGLSESMVPGLVEAVVPAVRAFLLEPDNIEFKVAPPEAKSILQMIMDVSSGADMIELFGLEVSSNTPD